MTTNPDIAVANKTVKDYYDAENETKIAARQVKSARDIAIADAIERGEKDPNSAANWTPELKLKIDEQSKKFETAAKNEKEQRKKVAEFETDLNEREPGEKRKIMEAAGLKPGDSEKSLYSAGNKDIQQNVINQRALEIQKQAGNVNENIDKNINKNLDKQDELQLEKSKLDPIKDEKKIKKIDENIDVLKIQNNELKTQQTRNKQNAQPENAKKIAKDELEKDKSLKEDDVTATTKIANTGFETINNHAPFYMQMPTLQSITDFRLKNGYSPYGDNSTDAIARDAVNFRIFETVPGVAKAVKIPGTTLIKNILDDARVQSVGSFTIYPSQLDWLNQTHQHNYASGPDANDNIVANVINAGSNVMSNVQTLMKVGGSLSQGLSQGSFIGLDPIADSMNRGVETLSFYQSSALQELSLEFNLFTKKDFLNDVFRPIMFLTALGYPKRSLKGEGADNFKLAFDNIRKWATEGNNMASNLLKGWFPGESIESILAKPLELAGSLEDKFANMRWYGSIFIFYFKTSRVYVGKARFRII